MFNSFTAPFTVSGASALVPAPPWHYAGWLLNVAFEFDASLGRRWIPPSIGRAVGRGCVHFADWQACTDGRELLDPVVSQYRETIVVVSIERPDGALCGFCPAIWVDQDISLVRGLLQGWPKKIGSTWLTRSLPIEHPSAAPLRHGTTLGASLAVKDRRLMNATAALTGTRGRPLGFLAEPTLGAVGWPDLRHPDQATEVRLLRADIRGRVESTWHAADATLQILDHPLEEVALLGDVKVTEASAGWVGLTVIGALDV